MRLRELLSLLGDLDDDEMVFAGASNVVPLCTVAELHDVLNLDVPDGMDTDGRECDDRDGDDPSYGSLRVVVGAHRIEDCSVVVAGETVARLPVTSVGVDFGAFQRIPAVYFGVLAVHADVQWPDLEPPVR